MNLEGGRLGFPEGGRQRKSLEWGGCGAGTVEGWRGRGRGRGLDGRCGMGEGRASRDEGG